MFLIVPIIRSVPVWLSWLQKLSWFHYAFEALLINQWSDVAAIYCPKNTWAQHPILPCLATGDQVLDVLSFEKVSCCQLLGHIFCYCNLYIQDNFWMNILMLVVLAVGMRAIAFLALVVRAWRK